MPLITLDIPEKLLRSSLTIAQSQRTRAMTKAKIDYGEDSAVVKELSGDIANITIALASISGQTDIEKTKK